MGPDKSLPVSSEFSSAEEFVDSLLDFATSSELLRTLCGGVHILDFFTRTPDLYSLILPQEWREFFAQHDMVDTLDLLMREDTFPACQETAQIWRGGRAPPETLISYIKTVRLHSLCRDFVPIQQDQTSQALTRGVALGMGVKKMHEVDHFSRYVEKLTADIADSRKRDITHLVDFGSGQGYLPRCLASPPYDKHMVAVESKVHNIEGAKNWDVMAKLAPKPVVMRNKKEWRAEQRSRKLAGLPPAGHEQKLNHSPKGGRGYHFSHPGEPTVGVASNHAAVQISGQGVGSIQYVEHWIKDGDLSRVIDQVVDHNTVRVKVSDDDKLPGDGQHFLKGRLAIRDDIKASDPNIMVISLHSCGNLVHHGIRSLLLNPAVSAVALIGCCYNLITERLGPATYKLPSLRMNHPRLDATANANDPHGFPMSQRLCDQVTPAGKGMRLNITARMMAVQAPQNWGREDSEAFFTRHFYRALLQRVFLDLGIVEAPTAEEQDVGNGSPLGWSGAGSSSGTQPIILGSLRRSCYDNFTDYVRAAQAKMVQEPERGAFFKEKLDSLSDEDIRRYEREYAARKQELSVTWSLMAFSAGVVEAVIVVDRWLFLKEQKEVAEAWVEPVFDYKLSPRNLLVVGIKREEA